MNGLPAIILAAGSSTRLGRPKQLEIFANERLLERAVRIARLAGCQPVVVLGCQADSIASNCDLGDAQLIRNEDWATGMASSLRVGVAAVRKDAVGLLVMTCDQPAVTPAHLRVLQEMGLRAGTAVASFYAGRRGVPAFVPQARFAELVRLTGDTGAREMLAAAPVLALAHGELDVDTETSVQQARVLLEG